ncbi:hypothetical protein FACS189472_07770 [Alphaproteobacteria bacterium]|nr:hypothetical protein FACS189472_07770 [Alphaproteobacteria bacterium]
MQNNLHKILALNEIGSVNELLQKFDPKLGVVEGIGKYSYLSVESTSPKPYTQPTEIVIPLTNSNVDIVEFHRSFFTLFIDICLNVWVPDNNFDQFFLAGDDVGPGYMATWTEYLENLDLFFIGFKNATDCIDSYKLQHNGVDIGTTMQNRASIESFLYNQMKPQIEKSNKHGSYSLWEDVVKGDESVCGVYFTYAELKKQLTADNHRIRVQFPVTIGFDMLLPLQGFNLFPNALFGDLSLVIKINPNALVWASTDPQRYLLTRVQSVWAHAANRDGCFYGAETTCQHLEQILTARNFSHRFTQMRTDGIARGHIYSVDHDGGVGSGSYVCVPMRMDPDCTITRSAVSTIMGFSLKDSVKQALAQYYSNIPFVVPGERIFIQAFSTGPSASGLNSSMNIPLINAKEIIGLFPRTPNYLTCFRNPEYHHLMLTLLNRNFPQKGCNSNSTEFYRMELESCNLDTILCPTQSFENSYLKKACPYFPMRQRCSEDDTDFLMIFNLERQSSNAFFADPVNSTNESITLTGSPQSQGIGDGEIGKGGDVYYYLNAEDDQKDDEAHKNHTAPILAVVSDTFWMFSTTERPVYEVAAGWNETLAKHYPDVLRRLGGSA